MWRGFNVDTRRRIRKVWEERLPLWQKTPDAGTQRQVQFLPLSARFWKRTGNRAHQGSGKRQTPAPLWMGALFNKVQNIVSFPKDMEMQTWRRAAWALAQFRHGERHHHRFGQEAQVSTDQRGKTSLLHVRWAFLFVEPSTNLTLPADGSIPNQLFVFVAGQRTLATNIQIPIDAKLRDEEHHAQG